MVGIDLYGLGVHSSVLVGDDSPALADAVRNAWSRCLEPQGDELPGGRFEISLTDDPRTDAAREAEPGELTRLADSHQGRLLQGLTQAVTMASIKAQTGRLLMLHAGAVTDPATGAAIAFVAPGGTGKTTLARTLGRTHGYVTDETVGIRADGTLVPYEKPLSVRPRPFDGVKVETSPDELGLAPVHPRAHLARVVLIRRDEAFGEPEVSALSTLDAIAELAPESSALSALPRPLHHLAELLDRLPPTLVVRYAEADDARPVLLDALAGAR